MRIVQWQCGFEREPLSSPFGFKGNYLSELWQIVVRITDKEGRIGLGTGVQSVLWSDAGLFTRYHESGGNASMLALTHFALEQATRLEWETPLDLQEQLLPPLLDYACALAGGQPPRLTFLLNALVPVDIAAWQLYAQKTGSTDFDAMIPATLRDGLSARHTRLCAVPLITYGTSLKEVRALAESGCALLKIKIGADPDGDGDREKMLDWDRKRLTDLHELLREFSCEDTHSGRIAYYLDANGRYDTIERVSRLLDHADQIGALEHIALLEEPFPEESTLDVGALPVCIVADESAHSVHDAQLRFDQGYGALALKPVAKTLSASLLMLDAAQRAGAACFCADLTVPPYLLEWNRNVAARLTALPSLRTGLLESNGAQNYRNWAKLVAAHPYPEASWIHPKKGGFELDDEFYRSSGGALEQPDVYRRIADPVF